ncbi:MAG: suppressor of fused domain protein [Oscillospiraceae bacterium]
MTREEYAKRMKKHPDWAPGRDAIEAAFARRYPKTEPVCFESELHDRAAFGGDEYLDGFAVYDTGKGYQHIVTYGMSELYPSMAAFGAEYSKWGYEMTMKVRESYAETGTWALDLLAQLARYTHQTGNFFEPRRVHPRRRQLPAPGAELGHHGAGHRQRHDRRPDRDGALEKFAFLQLVGLTQPELDALARDPDALDGILERMRADDPELVLDMRRTKSYV